MKTVWFLWRFISTSALSPSIVFAAAVVFVAVLRAALRRSARRIPWKALAALLCLLTAASSFVYLLVPTIQDDVEGGIASVSALALRGWPVYPAPGAVDRYIVAYGPLAFASRIPAYWLFGATLFSFKLPSVLAFFATLAGLYRICRHYASPGPSLVGVGCCSLVFFRFMPIFFSGRVDPFILCMLVLCIWATLDAPPWIALLVAASAFAVLPDMKITAGAYLFPVLWLIFIRRGWKMASGVVLLGVLLFSLPFLSPQVSIANYWFSLNNSRHALRIDILLRNLQYSALLLLPVLTIVAYRARNRIPLSKDQLIYLGLIICSITTVSFVGANFGSGPHHLVPCIVPIVDLYFWLESELPVAAHGVPFSSLAAAWTLSMLLFSTVNLHAFLGTLSHVRGGREAIAEIRSAEVAHPGQTVQVGVGKDFDDFRAVSAAVATLDGQPLTAGNLAIRELQVAGVDIPEATRRYMEQCGTRTWLIPKDDPPFSAPDPYFGSDHPAFDARFQNAFLEHYRKTASGVIYDTWSCASQPQP